MKLAGYLRISTVGQATEGLGLEDQERAIRTWTRQHGHRLVTVVQDAAISGTKDLDDRAGLAEALGMVKDGRAVGIVVYRLDRLARDMVLLEQLMAEVWRLGGEVFPPSGRSRTSTTTPRTSPGP
jgi:DNA invertase Pin-like site-specific DNA recombinase